MTYLFQCTILNLGTLSRYPCVDYWQNGAPASPPTDITTPDSKDTKNNEQSPNNNNKNIHPNDLKPSSMDEARALEEAKALEERMEASSIDFPTFLKGVAGVQ